MAIPVSTLGLLYPRKLLFGLKLCPPAYLPRRGRLKGLDWLEISLSLRFILSIIAY
jgi:hypothetical protein